MAVAAPRRRADRDEHYVGALDRGADFRREGKPPHFGILGDERFEVRLEDRYFAALEIRDLAFILVDADDLWPKSARQAPETSPT